MDEYFGMCSDLPNLPTLCSICLYANSVQIVPDRSEMRYDVMCPLCFDSFLTFFPMRPYNFRYREVHGKFPPFNTLDGDRTRGHAIKSRAL